MKYKKVIAVSILVIILALMLGMTCYAITDADVQSAVEASDKESVSGNLFVWFLCAVAFMKVSQKIDSFMGSLGISVGRTGDSMMGEIMVVAKTVGAAFKSGGFAGFGKGGGSIGNASMGGSRGIFGGFGQKMANGAASMVTGKNAVGGVIAGIGKKAYEGSVEKGGSFAASVIGSVARGDISKMGTITGSNGKSAMESYFGFHTNTNKNTEQTAGVSKTSKSVLEHGGATTITNKEDMSGMIRFDSYGNPTDGGSLAETVNGSDMNAIGIAEAVPIFSEIEMGGGRITGIETTDDFPEGRRFAMYDADKYVKPDGNFETVTAVDNSKWYKQYTAPTVEKTPYMNTEGKVQYHEKIVEKMPRIPMRKDKM